MEQGGECEHGESSVGPESDACFWMGYNFERKTRSKSLGLTVNHQFPEIAPPSLSLHSSFHMQLCGHKHKKAAQAKHALETERESPSLAVDRDGKEKEKEKKGKKQRKEEKRKD